MIPLFFDEISHFKKYKRDYWELNPGQMYQVVLNSGQKRYCRFYDRIGDTINFVKHFTLNGKLSAFGISIQSIQSIFEVDFTFDYFFEGRRIIKDYNKISFSLYEIDFKHKQK